MTTAAMAGRRYGSCVLKDVLMDVACGAAGSRRDFGRAGAAAALVGG
jgi:hypothetical protein